MVRGQPHLCNVGDRWLQPRANDGSLNMSSTDLWFCFKSSCESHFVHHQNFILVVSYHSIILRYLYHTCWYNALDRCVGQCHLWSCCSSYQSGWSIPPMEAHHRCSHTYVKFFFLDRAFSSSPRPIFSESRTKFAVVLVSNAD